MKSQFTNDAEFVVQKGIFPYDYVNSSVFNEKTLLSYDSFYSKLNKMNVSLKDYNHVLNVWNVFKCETIGDYSDL